MGSGLNILSQGNITDPTIGAIIEIFSPSDRVLLFKEVVAEKKTKIMDKSNF